MNAVLLYLLIATGAALVIAGAAVLAGLGGGLLAAGLIVLVAGADLAR